MLIGTVEVTLREHLSGYRSHTLILTLMLLLVFHAAVILTVASLTTVPKELNVGLLLVDVAFGHGPVQAAARALRGRETRAHVRGQALNCSQAGVAEKMSSDEVGVRASRSRRLSGLSSRLSLPAITIGVSQISISRE